MVIFRHSAANPGYGAGLPGIRDDRWTPVDDEPQTIPNKEYISHLQFCTSLIVQLHVL